MIEGDIDRIHDITHGLSEAALGRLCDKLEGMIGPEPANGRAGDQDASSSDAASSPTTSAAASKARPAR